jgi:hypothetical protein
MTHIAADRVKEISTTTGTGSLTLGGAVSGFRTFDDVMATNDTCIYVIQHRTAAEWEIGYGTLTGTTTFARTQIMLSSNSNASISLLARRTCSSPSRRHSAAP